jgi:hypothetical protein
MGMFDTDGKRVATEHLREARAALQELRVILDEVDGELQRAISEEDDQRAFPVVWVEMLQAKLLKVTCEISRCNGAVLVRATEPQKTEAVH